MRTDAKFCEHCGTRLLIVRAVPALNYGPDPAGPVAVTISDPRRGRFLARTEDAGPLEHRYSVHECDGQKRAAQRGKWSATLSRHRHGQRARRAQPSQVQQYLGFTKPPGRNQ